MIPPEAKPSLLGALPGAVASCSADGTPNVIHISQVYYVDPTHVALSFQFFNKTARNVLENPFVEIRCFDPATGDRWILEAVFVRRETDGPVFDQMEMQLEVTASMTGMSGVFKLKGSDIYEVRSIERVALLATSSAGP